MIELTVSESSQEVALDFSNVVSSILTSAQATIQQSDVIANTDALQSIYPYCVDIAIPEVTSNTQAWIHPVSGMESEYMQLMDGSNATSDGSIRIYMLQQGAVTIQITWLKAEVRS
jgi:hypothetical protein